MDENRQVHLSLEEILELGKRSSEGDSEAREQLILSHIWLVEHILPEYRGRGVDDQDLYQEGCYGLLVAVNRFDYHRGLRLSTYAATWIRKSMSEAIREQNKEIPMKIEKETLRYINRYRAASEKLSLEHGRAPTKQEIAAELHINENFVAKLETFLYTFASLDAPLPSARDRQPIAHYINEEPFSSSAEDIALKKITAETFSEEVKQVLTVRQSIILRRRLGFTKTGKRDKLREIAADLSCSIETVRKEYLLGIQKIKDLYL